MIRWFSAVALLAILTASSASAQGFLTSLSYFPVGGNTALTTTCIGSTPIPDGRLIRIFWDVNSNGPDALDPQPTRCVESNPELCPPGTVNFIEFPFNGNVLGGAPGFFTTTDYFISYGILPTPARYYLRVYEADGITLLWTSAVKTLASGPQDIAFLRSEWTCGAGGPQCIVRDESE